MIWLVLVALAALAVAGTAAGAPGGSVSTTLVSPNGTRWQPLEPEWVESSGVGGMGYLPPASREMLVEGQGVYVLVTPTTRATWLLLRGTIVGRVFQNPLPWNYVVRFESVAAGDDSKNAPVFAQIPTFPQTMFVPYADIFNVVHATGVK